MYQNTLVIEQTIMKQLPNKSWNLWALVFGLNVVALLGVIYLKSKGIDVFLLDRVT